MDSTAIAKYTPQEKRVFPGSSSSPCMDPDVIEIAPPSADEISKFKSKSKGKQKQIPSYEIIDVDMDEDCSDVVFIDAMVECNSKRKKEVPVELGQSFKISTTESNNLFDLDNDYYLALQSHFDLNFPTGVESPVPWFPDVIQMNNMSSSNPLETSHSQLASGQSQPNGVDPFLTPSRKRSTNKGVTITSDVKTVVPPQNMNLSYNNGSSIVGSSSSMTRPDNDDDVLKRYECFKKFDTVVDYSDHFFSKQNSAMKQPPKKWAKRIQKEWRILEKDLPDTIFVRVYESRMDILRAVIIGADGTPYHDGLFFFDVCFPSDYPNSPPRVQYRSGGLCINPNLYDSGYVCLSLLNTWEGSKKEMWLPGTSTMLQVLVSIQGLILNTKPYFNVAGLDDYAERDSLEYNENTLILSLKTMVYTMNNPPKNFEELVVGHFRKRVGDILMACKAYMEGVQVGCLVRGGVQDVDDEGDNKCSADFKKSVSSYIKTLIAAFKKIGANEADEFLTLSRN